MVYIYIYIYKYIYIYIYIYIYVYIYIFISTSSVQFLPKLIINHDLVPTVNIGSSFKYLGRYFSFSMNNVEHRSILLETINDVLCMIDKIPCHPKNKVLLYHRHVLSKISWHLTIADLSKTWVIENLDNKVADYVHRWFELPISASSTLVWCHQDAIAPGDVMVGAVRWSGALFWC